MKSNLKYQTYDGSQYKLLTQKHVTKTNRTNSPMFGSNFGSWKNFAALILALSVASTCVTSSSAHRHHLRHQRQHHPAGRIINTTGINPDVSYFNIFSKCQFAK